ncbi:class I SAM-dependent methyltransferase [Gordonia jinhuaensis]|uniref:Methyltransferase n=2 Tax=Gordonia jinhuaensis TaxID=1517702 RepID=A0A916WTL4_9ACTN|nr:putative methyltransferase [Gordonia jinhuaensis]
MTKRWNHKIHYHSVVLEAIPANARSALDVGTGDGLLATDLRRVLDDVVAIDSDAAALARARSRDDRVRWIAGDVQEYRFARTFDVVASIATLHHLPDLACALRRFAELTAPGGVMVVVGLARSSGAADVAVDAAGVLAHRWLSSRRGYWEHSAPTVWPPPQTYAEVRECAMQVLPGVRWKRLAMFRYALVWHRPLDR